MFSFRPLFIRRRSSKSFRARPVRCAGTVSAAAAAADAAASALAAASSAGAAASAAGAARRYGFAAGALLLLLLLLAAAVAVAGVASSSASAGSAAATPSWPQCTIVTGRRGVSSAFVATFLTAWSTSWPRTSRPKTTCLPSRCGVFANVMKNCARTVGSAHTSRAASAGEEVSIVGAWEISARARLRRRGPWTQKNAPGFRSCPVRSWPSRAAPVRRGGA